MKKVIYKNCFGDNPRKREVSVEETTNWANIRKGTVNKAIIVKKKACKYIIEKSFTSGKANELKTWINKEKSKGQRKNKHLFKTHDENTGETKIVCKMIGDFFVVHKNTVFKIVYVNQIKVHIADEKNGLRYYHEK